MAREVCQQIIAHLTGREDVSEAEVLRLEGAVRKRANVIQARAPATTESAALREAVAEITREAEAAASAQRRAVLLNEGKRLQAQGRITGNWGKQLGLGLRSMVTGTQRNVAGARISAAGQQDVARGVLVGGLHGAVSRLGKDVLRLFTSDALEDDIGRALFALARDTPDAAALAKLDPNAVKLAQAIRQQQELARTLLNREGAAIGKYDGYIARQAHDVTRIARDEAGWRAMAAEHFDLPRMLAETDAKDADALLDSLYRALSTGLHLKAVEPPSPTQKRGLGSLANRLSQARVIHFKDADGYLAYNRQFGAGTLREAVVHGLEQAGKSVGLMQVLGTNPAAFLDSMEASLVKELKKSNPDADAVARFRTDVANARKRLAEVDGSLDIPGHAPLASFSSGVRMLQTMASLGGSTVSSYVDVAGFLVGARHNGVNVFQAADAAIRGIFTGRKPAERAEIASALGVVFESLAGKMASRFSLDDGTRGALAHAQAQFFRLNLQNWWTDGLRFAAAEMLSHNLASHAGKAWADLDPRLVRTLTLYGLDAAGWKLARGAVEALPDGRAFLNPSAIEDEGVQRALRAYFTDQNGYLLLSPDSESRYLTKAGTQRGTVAGELVRFMAQFKSYTVAFTQKMVGRELIGNIDVDARGLGAMKDALGSGAAMLGMAQLVALTTVFGYQAMAMKDLLKGKKPRDPSDPRTALAAMQQGGGLGIMGDFLFGRANRTGGGFIGTLAGPLAGDIESLANMYFTAREAALDPEKKAQLGDDLFRLTWSNVPGNNLFYVKPVLDYLLLWNVQEMLNPGAMQRLEKGARNAGQEYLVSPAQRVREQGNPSP
jgi:hypothetical protein